MPEGADLRAVLTQVMIEHDVTNVDGGLHSWRCAYPETYGCCECVADLVADLVRAVQDWQDIEPPIRLSDADEIIAAARHDLDEAARFCPGGEVLTSAWRLRRLVELVEQQQAEIEQYREAICYQTTLRKWKAEVVEVMRGLQDLGTALGIPLGERVTGETAVEKARALRAKLEAVEALAESVEIPRWHHAAVADYIQAGRRDIALAVLAALADEPGKVRAAVVGEPEGGDLP